MDRIGAVLDEVEPAVVVVTGLLYVPLSALRDEGLVSRQGRGLVSLRSEVGKDETAELSDGIREVADLLMGRACLGLRRLL
jgi:hypothetical protein